MPDFFDIKRNEQTQFWLKSTIEQGLQDSFFKNKLIAKALQKEIDQLSKGKTTPFTSAQKLLNLYNEQS